MKQNKKAQVERETSLWILAIIILVVLVIVVFFLKNQGINLLNKILDILRFGR